MKNITRYKFDDKTEKLIDLEKNQQVHVGYDYHTFFKKRTNKIKRERKRIDDLMSKLVDQKAILQNQCQHKNAVHSYAADTGNYDPSLDRYWIEIRCFDCYKCWTVEQ